MKSIYIFLSVLPLVLLTNCKDEEYEFQFGETQTDFIADSIYQAETNGFLYVQFEATSSACYVTVLSDKNPEPITEIATVPWDQSVTLPIQKGNTWIVIPFCPLYHVAYVKDLAIRWTPIL